MCDIGFLVHSSYELQKSVNSHRAEVSRLQARLKFSGKELTRLRRGHTHLRTTPLTLQHSAARVFDSMLLKLNAIQDSLNFTDMLEARSQLKVTESELAAFSAADLLDGSIAGLYNRVSDITKITRYMGSSLINAETEFVTRMSHRELLESSLYSFPVPTDRTATWQLGRSVFESCFSYKQGSYYSRTTIPGVRANPKNLSDIPNFVQELVVDDLGM